MRNTLALSILLALGLSACGKNQEATTSNAASTSNQPAQTASTPADTTQSAATTAQTAETKPQTAKPESETKAKPAKDANSSSQMVQTSSAAADGAAIYRSSCAACHGANGQGQGMFPKLAGKSTEQLSELLHKYKSGQKVGPQTAMMAPNAAKLSDDEILAVSKYLSALQ